MASESLNKNIPSFLPSVFKMSIGIGDGIYIYIYIYIYIHTHTQWRRKVPKSVCVWGGGGGGGAHRHVSYVPSEKSYIWIYGYLLTAICVSLLKLSTR